MRTGKSLVNFRAIQRSTAHLFLLIDSGRRKGGEGCCVRNRFSPAHLFPARRQGTSLAVENSIGPFGLGRVQQPAPQGLPVMAGSQTRLDRGVHRQSPSSQQG